MERLEEAKETAREIINILDDLADNPNAEEFCSSVRTKTESMLKGMEERGSCTEPMYKALVNMKAGAEKWLPRD